MIENVIAVVLVSFVAIYGLSIGIKNIIVRILYYISILIYFFSSKIKKTPEVTQNRLGKVLDSTFYFSIFVVLYFDLFEIFLNLK